MSKVESKTRHITVVIPEDSTAEEGDFLEFHVDGHDLSIPVPAGAKPGDSLDIIISEDDLVHGQIEEEEGEEEDDDEYETITVDLCVTGEGTVPLLLDTSPILVEGGKEVNDGDHTHSVAWPSGISLAKFLTLPSSSSMIQNKNILELGSGLGVAGLAAAVAGAKKVVLTDVPGALPVLSRSVKDTKEGVLQKLNPNVDLSVEPHVWGERMNDIGNASEYDAVIGSDLIYDPNCEGGYEALAQSLAGSPLIIMTVRWRKPDLERKFFEIMEDKHGYSFEVISIPDVESNNEDSARQDRDLYLPCPLTWKEYGHPECEAFKKYFQSMMITVAGSETVSLSEIHDAQIEKFSDEEFAIFEAAQTQIYRGVPKVVE